MNTVPLRRRLDATLMALPVERVALVRSTVSSGRPGGEPAAHAAAPPPPRRGPSRRHLPQRTREDSAPRHPGVGGLTESPGTSRVWASARRRPCQSRRSTFCATLDRLSCSGVITAVSLAASLACSAGCSSCIRRARLCPYSRRWWSARSGTAGRLRHQLGSIFCRPGRSDGVGLLRAFDVAGEVDEVDVAELFFLAGDLRGLHFLDEVGGAIGKVLRLELHGGDTDELADVVDQLGAAPLVAGVIALPWNRSARWRGSPSSRPCRRGSMPACRSGSRG